MTKEKRKPIVRIVKAKQPNYKAVVDIIIDESLKSIHIEKTKEDIADKKL